MNDAETAKKNESALFAIFNTLASYDHFLPAGGTTYGGSKLLNTLNGCEVVYEPATSEFGTHEESFYLIWNGDKTYPMNVEEAQKYSWVMGSVASQYSLLNTSLPHKMNGFLDKQAKD